MVLSVARVLKNCPIIFKLLMLDVDLSICNYSIKGVMLNINGKVHMKLNKGRVMLAEIVLGTKGT